MKINIVERDTFFICGYSIETTSEQNEKDVSALYQSFFGSGKEAILRKLKGCKNGYFGLSWYTKGHERYCYLLGMEVDGVNNTPEGSSLKKIMKTTYAIAHFPKEKDIIKAWTEFFYDEIPKTGFRVNEEHNLYFEYYPLNVEGEYELWVPVVKTNV